MNYIIYKITNIINNRCYIGQTNNFKRRYIRHKKDSKKLNTYLYRAIRKYSWNNFEWKILCECNDREELNIMEIHYISFYNSYNDGYNMTLGGEGHNGLKPSKETRKKISKANKKIKKSKEWCKKISKIKKKNYIKENHPNYNKHLSKETREKISNSHKGKKLSKETKNKISNFMKSEKYPKRNNYRIISPENIITETRFLKNYCEYNNLVYSCMTKVARGERKHHKQYKIYKLED